MMDSQESKITIMLMSLYFIDQSAVSFNMHSREILEYLLDILFPYIIRA